MELQPALGQLEQMGTEQNRKIYGRHGVAMPMYGVSFANLGKLKKKIRVDHALALALWRTGNHDARVLATMVADPARLDRRTLELWVADLGNYVLTDALSGLVARSPHIRACAEAWRQAPTEWVASCGWNLTGMLAGAAPELSDAVFAECLRAIEARVHQSPNRVRYSMLLALVGIGTRSAALHRLAVDAATRIGKVEVDHGETGCKTPDPIPYMERTLAHRAGKAGRAAPAKKKAAKKPSAAKSRKKTQKKPQKKAAKKPAKNTAKKAPARRARATAR